MAERSIYDRTDIETVYEQVHDLLITKDIIRTYSTNKGDIRKTALEGLDLSEIKSVLELGCGYGFFIEALVNRLHPGAEITGIDIVENNMEAYLNTVLATGYKAVFIKDDVDIINKYPDDSFDLIIACYSLYFFPHLIPFISRILKNDGFFIAVTHSAESLGTAVDIIHKSLNELDIKGGSLSISKLFSSFSAENGYGLLSPYFSTVTPIDYENTLVFSKDNAEDCFHYIEMKKNLIYKDVIDSNPSRLQDLKKVIYKNILEYAEINNGITLNKNDRIFRCFHKG